VSPAAVEQAKERLEVADEALAKLRDATVTESFKGIRKEWTNFLLAGAAIYSKLEQGAKSNGKSAAWFGRIKKIRKDDELLRYIHHARNSDYHGIAPVVREGNSVEVLLPSVHPFAPPPSLHATLPEGFDPKEFWIEGHESITGRKVPMKVLMKKYLAIVRVKDEKHGDIFDPPTMHLGEPIEVDEPLGIAMLAINYLRDLVAEAEHYVVA
jgi:hypothetical protein